MAPQGAVLWQSRGHSCRKSWSGLQGTQAGQQPQQGWVPQGGVGCQRMTCLAWATVLVRNWEVSGTVGCVGLRS